MQDSRSFQSANTPESLRLLVIDDDPADRALIKAMIQLAQFDVLEAATGEAGIELAKMHKIDCAIVDQRLPDMIGTEVFDELRSSTGDEHLPIILFTGQGDELLAVEAMHGGAADYLPKQTLSPISLGTALTNALQQARLRRELSAERMRLIEVNRELVRANAELSCFYETVAQQLRSPLNAIRELTAITLDGKGGTLTEEQEEYLTASLTSCDRLNHTINGLVDILLVETGKLPYHLVECDMNAIIKDCVDSLQEGAEQAGLIIDHNLQQNLPVVKGDKLRLKQLFHNLITNAINFTDRQGRVCVESRTLDDNTVAISVSDTGSGINPKFVDNIFERFSQARIEDSEFHQGLGIGLYVCADIASHHKGALSVTSELNQGSTFTLTLPIEKAKEEFAPHSAV